MIAQPNARRSWRPYLLVLLPSLFLLVFFVIPNAFLLAASFLKSDAQVLTDEFSLEAYGFLFTRPLYQRAIVWSRHPRAPSLLAGLSFVEAIIFPVPPEVMLALFWLR